MPEIVWDADLYDHKHGFVSGYGGALVSLLDPQKGERVLDVGCGTGQLAQEMSKHGAKIVGIDRSPDMISKAKETYPDLEFEVKDATAFDFSLKPFDAIFSNATLHWVNDKDKAAKCMFNALKPGGRLVLEMGGKGNIQSIEDAIDKALNEQGVKASSGSSFYFPSMAEYTSVLENAGFRCIEAYHFDRPTKLSGEDGMYNWIKMFASSKLANLTIEKQEEARKRAVEILRPSYFRDGDWYADYVRLRVKAIRPERKICPE